MQKKLRLEVLERDDNACQLCEQYTYEPPHHIIHGAGKKVNELYNIITLCGRCHWKTHSSNVPGEAEKYKQKCIQWSVKMYGDKIIKLAKFKGRRIS